MFIHVLYSAAEHRRQPRRLRCFTMNTTTRIMTWVFFVREALTRQLEMTGPVTAPACRWHKIDFKGTVQRDFLPPDFFLNKPTEIFQK